MAEFERYAPLLRRLEGGWVDDPDDPGGATMQGVTLATFRRHYGQERTKAQLRAITNDQWLVCMRPYWTACRGNHIVNQSLADIFVDAYVNSGQGGIKAIQRDIGVTADGRVGPVTYGRLNAMDSRQAFYLVKKSRLDYYTRLVNARPALRKFIHGWFNRVNSFRYEREEDKLV